MEEMQSPAQPEQRPGLFHKAPQQPDLTAFSEDIGNLSRRLRLLEESVTNIRRALQVTEQNMLSKNKLFSADIRTLTSDISDIKKDIADVKEKIVDVVKELQEAAKRDEVKVLEKYINYWNPVKFVTQNEVEDLVKEIVKKNQSKEIKNK